MNMRNKLIIGICLTAIVALTIWGGMAVSENESLKNAMENQYQQDFETLYATMRDMAVKLEKTAASSDESFIAGQLADISKLSAEAADMIGRLPVSHISTERTVSFLSQTEDFSSAMLRSTLRGKSLSEENKEGMLAIAKSSRDFLDELNGFYEQLQDTDTSYTWTKDNTEYYLTAASENLFDSAFTDMEESFVDYPTMIYDGPFSDHLLGADYKGISGEEVSKEDISGQIAERLGAEEGDIDYAGVVEGGIRAHAFNVARGEDSIYMHYSVTGGNLLLASSSTAPSERKLSVEQAQQKAEEFMRSLGVDTMTPTYHEIYSNTAVFNFAYLQDDVRVYSDLIKVQVSLADGAIIGYEANGYYANHEVRTISTPKITAEQAERSITVDIEITNIAKALIPTPGKNEVLCWELKGTKGEDKYIIYVNAETGGEEQIFKLIEADESVLTL